MREEHDSNIFDEAAKKRMKKKIKRLFSPSSADSLSQNEPATKSSDGATKVIGDPEVEDMLNRIKTMDEDLQYRMSKICDLSGMSKRDVINYIENPDNFTSIQWARVQREKDELEEAVYKSIGMKAKKRLLEKKKKKIAKGRRGKTLGSRKGWIQM